MNVAIFSFGALDILQQRLIFLLQQYLMINT